MKYLIQALLLGLVFSACKKEPADTTPPTIVAGNWQKINLPQHDYKNLWIWTAGHDSYIYVAGSPNTSPDQDYYFVQYDVVANAFSDLDTPTSPPTAGRMTNLVIDDFGDLYYFSERGRKYTVSTNTWTELAYPEQYKDQNSGGVYLDNKIYYTKDQTVNPGKFQFYDIDTDSWNLNHPGYPFLYSNLSSVAYNNELHFFAYQSWKDSTKVHIYNPANKTWRGRPGFRNRAFVNAQLNGYFYFVQREGDSLYTKVYDPNTNDWIKQYNMPDELHFFSLVAANGHIYLVNPDVLNGYMLSIYKLIE